MQNASAGTGSENLKFGVDDDDELFCGTVDQQMALSLISSWDHCHRSSMSQIYDMLLAGFKPGQNLSSGLVEWSCAVVITTVSWRLFYYFIALRNLWYILKGQGYY